MTSCRFVATDQPRMLRTHVRDCNASGCEGCMPCEERHCNARKNCGRHLPPLDGVCPTCVGNVRDNLRRLQRLQRNMLGEAIIRGVNSQAAMLAGPVADTAGTHEQRACRCPGLTCPDYADRIGPAHQDCRHESCRWITGWARRCPSHRTWEADNYDEPHALTTLGDWDQELRLLLNQPTTLKVTVERAADYLRGQLTDLARRDDFAFDEFAKSIDQCCRHLEDTLRDGDRDQTGSTCPMCGKADLHKTYGDTADDDRWDCPRRDCNGSYTEHDYRTKVEAVYVLHADALTASQVAHTYRVPEATVRKWAQRGQVRKHRRGGVVLYDVDDVKRMTGRDTAESA